MSKLVFQEKSPTQSALGGLYESLSRRTQASPVGNCPLDVCASYLRMCRAQSCGKCVPCRIGLSTLSNLLDKIAEGEGDESTLELLENTASVIADTADCAIGYEAADSVLQALSGFRDDFISHLKKGVCSASFSSVPCVSRCPAHVDIPGYIALAREGRYADAVRLIRKDNPFPGVCGLVCEHPCEESCRRTMVDAPVNIRAIKRFAVDMAGQVPVPACASSTGKTVAVVGGGPSGLTAAYYLSLMGHKVTVFEKRKRLGGMLRYGIPAYRLPDAYLDADISRILSTGIKVNMGMNIGKDMTLTQLKHDYDSVYISIGAHGDNKLEVDGEDGKGVFSAVEMLSHIGDGGAFDLTGKSVVVIGGGNVAMDVTRTSLRCGAKSVKCVYRRRIDDMTAMAEEVDEAMAEGAEILPLAAPVKILLDEQENVKGLLIQPQMISVYDRGRPKPIAAKTEPEVVSCDVVIVAIGQSIQSKTFEKEGIPAKWGKFLTNNDASLGEGVFAGGDCVFGPETVIRAIEAGKVAARNMDTYLGFHHEITADVEIPAPAAKRTLPCGRVNNDERQAGERKNDFALMEKPLRIEEAVQECSRCLCCDHYGMGSMKEGRCHSW
ncbi:MAG TPA: glutamate synthase [Clostridiales bacterium]|nr:glutamate synthase [Clostridiales bacterium]